MTLTKRWSWFLVGFAVFSWVIWPTFIKNIANDDRAFVHGDPQPFFWVHLVLAVVSLALGSAIGYLGARGLRSLKSS